MNISAGRGGGTDGSGRARVLVRLLFLYALLVGGYWVLRYSGRWLDTDTAYMTRAIEAIRDRATVYATEEVYEHGFGYQAVSLAVMFVTGLPILTLQRSVYPFLAGVFLALTAVTFYTQVLRDSRTAVLATMFLLLQADVLFVTMRGSHEKLVWPLMMVALTLLCLSLRQPQRRMGVYVGLFYVAVFALISTNVFFASTFLVAVSLSLLLGTVLHVFVRRRLIGTTNLGRLIYVTFSCGVLIFTFVAYVYPPALRSLQSLRTVWRQTSMLLLGFEDISQPYEYISYAWLDRQTYLALTGFTWLLVAASFAEWLVRGKRMLDHQDSAGLRESLDWLLYGGFAIQVALSIIVDFSGVLGTNLQLRVFPGFTVMAALLLARAARRVFRSTRLQGRARQLALLFIGLVTIWFGIAAILKASNEPLLSNRWSFHSSAEAVATEWTDTHLKFTSVWSGLDARLAATFFLSGGYLSRTGNTYVASTLESRDRYVLFSETDRLRYLRMGTAMPSVLDWDRAYDNGVVQLHCQPPKTPYQR